MSDKEDLDIIMKTLETVPDEEVKQRIKVSFLKKAEEAMHMSEEKQTDTKKLKLNFLKSKQSIFSFVAGMAAMLMLSVGIISAINPSYLMGTVANNTDTIRYRMFASYVDIPEIIDASKYLGELSILHSPGQNRKIYNDYTLCDGKKISFNDNAALFSVLQGGYGYDFVKHNFGIPDYSKNLIAQNFNYLMVQSGIYPDPSGKKGVVIGDIEYVSEDFSESTYNFNDDICFGEIVLLKTSDQSFIKDRFILCEGQTLQAADHPVLASIIAPTEKAFSLPDLREKSPIVGAKFYISSIGMYPYISSLPDGYKTCLSCGKTIPVAPFCMECGARQ